jgi:RHS repeat-associated protein
MSSAAGGGKRGAMTGWRARHAGIATAVAFGLLVPMLAGSVPAVASAPGGRVRYDPPIFRGPLWKPRKVQVTPSAPGRPLSGRPRPAQPLPTEPGAIPAVPWHAHRQARWPAGAGTARLTQDVAVRKGRLAGAVIRRLAGPQPAGALPVTVSARASAGPADVAVDIALRRSAAAAGVSGLLMHVAAASPGTVSVTLDYAGFADDFGGSWGSRLKLVELPACAAWDPSAAACRTQIPVPTSNNGAWKVSASVRLGSLQPPGLPGPSGRLAAALAPATGSGLSVELATISVPGGEAGNYAATSLNPEGSWVQQDGGFDYSYPITVPPPLGGQPPQVSLDYSSQTIDGITSAQNPQGGQIGDGWTYSPGYIEQSFEPCSQDSAATTAEAGDECWDGWNATLSLAGHSGTLIGSGPGTWHLQNDDGTQIQLDTNGVDGIAGSYGDEYWVVTTTNGTEYYFGADHVPGDTSSAMTASSAWNVPVYCPRSTDPCNSSSTGTASWAQMPYRWNLDYVIDPDDNLTTYQYATETNYYMRGGSTGADGTLTSYIRAGYLTTIKYGWTLAYAKDNPQVLPSDEVTFTPSPRCTASSCTTVNGTNYPDVPTDQICSSTDTSCDNASPTYFSEERLTGITTSVLASQSSKTYNKVDSYALAQEFSTGTGEDSAVMSLTSITRTGEDGTTTAPLPPVSFGVEMMNNRVTGSSQPGLFRPRIVKVDTGTGAALGITYNGAVCAQGTGGNITDADAPDNTLACYPAYWAPPGDPDSMDWFNQYTVAAVTETDETGVDSDAHVTSYQYLGGAAWHQDENPAVPSAWRTWDEFRGYLKVETTTGVAPDPVTEKLTWYMRGMDGDANGSGGTTSVQVTDSLNDSYTDSDWLAGQVLETDTYTASGGSPDQEVLSGPWTYNPTATMTPPSGSGLSTLTAEMLAQSQTRTRRLLASGSWQTSATTSYYNSSGLVQAVDTAPAGLTETCTSTSYAQPPGGNSMMIGYPYIVTTVTGGASGGDCPAANSSGSNVVSETQSYYDQTAPAPTDAGPYEIDQLASPGGLATGVSRLESWGSGGGTWQTTLTGYDGYGRVTSQTDGNGKLTTTSFSPASEQLPTSVTVKNPMGWSTVTILDQARQLPTLITDPNGLKTSEAYDALGRVTSVTLPIDQGYKASYTYAYTVSAATYQKSGTGPSVVTTDTLVEDGGYSTSIAFYDGMLQPVEVQSTPSGFGAGRLISYTSWNSDGWQASTTPQPYWDETTSPDATYDAPQPENLPDQILDTYDGQGRVTAAEQYYDDQFQWQTGYSYPGMDETVTTPPAGGTPTEVTTNSAGQTATSTTYADTSSPTANTDAADTTTYSYTPAGQVATIADANSNTWTYGYDLLGQKVSAIDPGTTGKYTTGADTSAGESSYTYDGDGNTTSVTDPDGTVLTYDYDSLNRKTEEINTTVPGEPVELASWAYDTAPLTGGTSAVALGQPVSSTSYDANGQAYTETITGYDSSYQATGTALSLPADAGAFACNTNCTNYTTTTAYTPRTGLAEYTEYSADGGLPAETVEYAFNTTGELTQIGGTADYLDGVTRSPQGQITSTTFGTPGEELVEDYYYDEATGRLESDDASLQALTSAAADIIYYTYNQAGDLTSASDQQNTGGTDTQCFSYTDSQLTTAWTDTGTTTATANESNTLPPGATGTCTNTSPAAANIGGPAPYWETWTYDLLGDRTSQTTYDTALPAAQDTLANATTQQASYPGGSIGSSSPGSNAPGTAEDQPDTTSSIVTTTPGGKTTTTPGYNADGQETGSANTTTGSTPPPGPDQFAGMSYTPQGQVSSVTAAAGRSTYLYDADGNLLIQTDPNGTSTLYADGGAEQISATNGTITSGDRFYTAPDGTQTVRTSAGGVYFETTNQQHTAVEAINAASDAITRRYYDPYGNLLNPAPSSWPDSNAYLGQPADTETGLDLLGARQYNPATGTFTSLDPIFEAGNPLDMGGYAYAANNPATNSDPTGNSSAMLDGGGGCSGDAQQCPTGSNSGNQQPANPGTASYPCQAAGIGCTPVDIAGELGAIGTAIGDTAAAASLPEAASGASSLASQLSARAAIAASSAGTGTAATLEEEASSSENAAATGNASQAATQASEQSISRGTVYLYKTADGVLKLGRIAWNDTEGDVTGPSSGGTGEPAIYRFNVEDDETAPSVARIIVENQDNLSQVIQNTGQIVHDFNPAIPAMGDAASGAALIAAALLAKLLGV